MEFINVELRNYQKYKGRKDVDNPTWFRCSNRLLEDPDFYRFTHEEILVWVYIMSLSSRKRCEKVAIDVEHCERACRISLAAIKSSIEKLRVLNILLDVTSTSRRRNTDGTRDARIQQTDRQTNKQKKSAQDAPDGFLEAFKEFPVQTKGPLALKRFKDQIKTPEDQSDLLAAIRNYKSMLAIETWRTPKQQFDTFLGTERTGYFWREFINWKSNIRAASGFGIVEP